MPGCRSTSISAASSTRSCICSIRASSPGRCARPAISASTSRSPACSPRAWSCTRPIATPNGDWVLPADVQIETSGDTRTRDARQDRRADRDRRHREDVEVEEEHRRSRRHHGQLRRRCGALVHAVRFAARARRDLDGGRRAGRLPLRAAAVAAGRRDGGDRRERTGRAAGGVFGGCARHPQGRAWRAGESHRRHRAAALQPLRRAHLRTRQHHQRGDRQCRRRWPQRHAGLRLGHARSRRHPGAAVQSDDAASRRGMLGRARPRHAGRAAALARSSSRTC